MPSGAKKRKALKKKKEKESIGISEGNNNGDNLHGNDDPGSQDDKESDGSLSSPSSQGNGEAGKRGESAKEKVETYFVDSEKPVVAASEVLISGKNEQVETSTDSKQKSGDNEVKLLPRVEKDKDDNVLAPSEPAETSKEVKTAKESEIPECSEEKRPLASGPPVMRTSWLSCCGLFEAMTGSER